MKSSPHTLLQKNMVSSDFCWRKIEQLENLSADNLKRRSHHLQFILILGFLTHQVYEDANMVWVLSGSLHNMVDQQWSLYLLLPIESVSSPVLPSRLLWIEPIKYPIPRNVIMVEDVLIQSDLFTWTEVNWGIISHWIRSVNVSKRRGEDRKDGEEQGKRDRELKRQRERKGGKEERDFLGLYDWKDRGIYLQVRLDQVDQWPPQGQDFSASLLYLWQDQDDHHKGSELYAFFLSPKRDEIQNFCLKAPRVLLIGWT